MNIQNLLTFIQIDYVRAIVTFLVFFIVSKIFVFISEKGLLRLARKTRTKNQTLGIHKKQHDTRRKKQPRTS